MSVSLPPPPEPSSTRFKDWLNQARNILIGNAAGSFTSITATDLVDISASGAGQIKFPAVQHASSNANTLDDYEEGTWTPTVTAATGSFTTVAASGATYTKVGNRVNVRLQILITTNGTAAGNIQFTLPFNPAEDTPFMAFETDITGFVGGGFFNAATNKGVLVKYDGTYLGANGYRIDIAGTYRA